jgi:hypothetical protein
MVERADASRWFESGGLSEAASNVKRRVAAQSESRGQTRRQLQGQQR